MKKSEYFDFEKDLSINKFRLDEECLSHSSIYFKYSDACQEAKSEVSKAKDNLELVQAERRLQIREDLVNGGAKVTESMVESSLIMDEKVREAKEQLRESETVYNKLLVAVQAMDTRRSELDNLVKLYCAGYFSVSNGSSDTKKSVTEMAEKEMRKNLNK